MGEGTRKIKVDRFKTGKRIEGYDTYSASRYAP
jgi:hypothetical protein